MENSTSSLPFLHFPAFEGEKFLISFGTISMASPDDQPIQSYSMRLFLPRTSMYPWYIWTTGQSFSTTEVDTWLTVAGTLNSPVQKLTIIAQYGIEVSPGYIGIDAVQFVTIPEPKTFWLLAFGLSSISLRPLIKRSAHVIAKT